MSDTEIDERCRQIEALLAFPKVGPLSAAAIGVNLGTGDSEIRAALGSLLREGRIKQIEDGRFTGIPKLTQEPSVCGHQSDRETWRHR